MRLICDFKQYCAQHNFSRSSAIQFKGVNSTAEHGKYHAVHKIWMNIDDEIFIKHDREFLIILIS